MIQFLIGAQCLNAAAMGALWWHTHSAILFGAFVFASLMAICDAVRESK